MLDCTGNTDCKVYIRTNSLTCLTYLKLFWKPSVIYYGTGAAYSTTDHVSQILKHLEVLCASDTTATGYENLCIHDINGIRKLLNNVKNLNILVVRSKSRIVLNHLSLSTGNRINLLHYTRTNCCHLRTVVRTCDCCDGVTTKCRTSHKKLIVLLLLSRDCIQREITDFKYSTVCCQTCSYSC